MRSFREYLKNYLEQKNISYVSAAKSCGIDRTLISKYVKGIRRPKTSEAVIELAQALELSPEQSTQLCEAYKRELIYESYQVDYERIKEIYQTDYTQLSDEKTSNIGTKNICKLEATQELNTKQEVLETLYYLLQGATHIRVLQNPEHGEVLDILKGRLAEEKNCKLEQIIVFEKTSDGDRNKKLQYLKELLALLFYAQEGTVYYHYYLQRKEIENTAFENYILIDSDNGRKGILFFSSDLERGFFSNEEIACDFYGKQFQQRKQKCRLFITGGRNYYSKWMKESSSKMKKNDKTGTQFSMTDKENIWVTVKQLQGAVYIKENDIYRLWKELLRS